MEERETPVVTRDWCPECEPDVDPFRELVLEKRCAEHRPSERGFDDRDPWYAPGHVEVDPATNRAMNDLLFRRAPG